MAETDLISRQPSIGAVSDAYRWGILRLVRRWPSEQAAAGGHAERWPGVPFQPERPPRHLAVVPLPDPTFDRQAAAVELRQVLARWRLAELDLEETIEGTLEWTLLSAQIASLRSSYQRLFADIRWASRNP